MNYSGYTITLRSNRKDNGGKKEKSVWADIVTDPHDEQHDEMGL